MSDEKFQCRICFEEEDNHALLIAPCRCNGTSKYVHIDCLKTWIRTCDNEDAKKKCMECRSAYKYTTSALEEDVTMYNDHNRTIWKTFIKNQMLIFPSSLFLNCIDNYILHNGAIIKFIYNPNNQIEYFFTYGNDEFYGFIFYVSNTMFIFNTRFLIIYLYRVYRSIHRKSRYLKSMTFSILSPLIGIIFFLIINKIIMSYDDVGNFISFNFLYIIVSQILNYILLKQHKDTIEYMNSDIEIDILSYIDDFEIDIETRSLELVENL